MQHYRISFGDDDDKPAALTFEAADLKDALAMIAESDAKHFELWCEGQFLGRLQYLACDEGLFWRLG